jgi:adenine-specific DNA-methyltransferase
MALARQRLLTATFPFYKVKGSVETNGHQSANPAQGFVYKTVPHITLKSIAQNVALDTIFAKHQPILDEKLGALNATLKMVTPELRRKLVAKLLDKERREGKKAVTDADRRRWQLPKDVWQEWEVPFDADEDWAPELKVALMEYRTAWRAKMDDVDACIAASAEQEELVDQSEVVRGVVRVSGPFTVEAVMPAEESLDAESPIGGEPEELETFGQANGRDGAQSTPAGEPLNAEAYLDKMLRLLRADGVRFPNNKILKFTRLEPCGGEYLHAEGEWETEDGQTRMVAVSFGPQFGPVTAFQVENTLPLAMRRGFDDLVFAGFSFDGAAQAVIQDDPNPRVRCHLAHIRPDVNMGDLLKETPNSQIFTVFGSPRTELQQTNDGLFVIEMHGVDIYNPVDNIILPTNADKVAVWFLDTDYDGRTFCITQAFFPDKSAWEKLARALKGRIDEEKFAALSGTVSLPFPAGVHKRAAVKVIDPRGNEVMRAHRLDAQRGTPYADA